MRVVKSIPRLLPERVVKDIKVKMFMKGISPEDVARAAQRSVSTVRGVINGFGTSRRIKHTIAQLLGEDPDDLWRAAA